MIYISYIYVSIFNWIFEQKITQISSTTIDNSEILGEGGKHGFHTDLKADIECRTYGFVSLSLEYYI